MANPLNQKTRLPLSRRCWKPPVYQSPSLAPDNPNRTTNCWCRSPMLSRVNACSWACAKIRTTAPLRLQRWPTVTWSMLARPWMSTLPSSSISLINDMGLPLDRIIMDPTTGALGYGFEYGYSVMERLRLAALQGDSMTQMPMLVTPGEECWKAKESKVGEGVPESWGDWAERAITWETLTSVMLIESGANIVVLRHPESLKRTYDSDRRLDRII